MSRSSLYVAVAVLRVLIRCRFQAAEHSCVAQTFPYILIHFLPATPRQRPRSHSSPTKTGNSPPAGEVILFRSFCPKPQPRRQRQPLFPNNFFCTMNFCAFSTCMSCSPYSHAPIPIAAHCRKSIRCGCRSV